MRKYSLLWPFGSLDVLIATSRNLTKARRTRQQPVVPAVALYEHDYGEKMENRITTTSAENNTDAHKTHHQSAFAP